MNECIKQLTLHTSIRKFTSEPIHEDIVQAILTATQQSPSWINGQQMSIIRITDIEKRHQLQQLAGNQQYVSEAAEFWVFCLDFYRSQLACAIEQKPFAIADNIDALIVGATDVGIALGTAVVAAESFGLGTVPIGGVRKNVEAVIDLLELPQHVYPISGLCIGHKNETPLLKPRLPQQAVVFANEYRLSKNTIEQYNETFSNYMSERTNGVNTSNWSSGIAAFYSEPFYRDNSYANALTTLQKQGFLNEK